MRSSNDGASRGSYSADEIREKLQQKADELGSQTALAAACGVTKQFLSQIICGKAEPSGRPLAFLGLRRVVRYEPDPAEDEFV